MASFAVPCSILISLCARHVVVAERFESRCVVVKQGQMGRCAVLDWHLQYKESNITIMAAVPTLLST